MRSVAEELLDRIDAAGGSLGFDGFMEVALYGESGFYTTTGRAGRRGDFLTSPEVGPLFGAVVARMLDDEWDRLGRPDNFVVVDLGAGPGTLARTVLASSPRCLQAGRYVAVEISPQQRAQHPGGIESLASFDEESITGVVIANELLDNIPFRLAVHDGIWREARVIHERGRFLEILGPLDTSDLDGILPTSAALGARVPLQSRAAELVDDFRGRLHQGRLVVFDYTTPTTPGLAERPWRSWLRTYRHHERGAHYLAEPGTQDITSEVAIDQLIHRVGEPDAVRTQAQWLGRWGIDDLVEEGRRIWTEQAASPGLEAVRMRSRIAESQALLDPEGLGAFGVLEWSPRSDRIRPA